MLVRCVRILEGGRSGGRDISTQTRSSSVVAIGQEYPVLGIRCSAQTGVHYSILRADVYPASAPASIPAEMFEIVNSRIPSSWVVSDFYGSGQVIHLLPKAWADQPEIFERKLAGDGSVIPLFTQEVERIYAEEGLVPPQGTRAP